MDRYNAPMEEYLLKLDSLGSDKLSEDLKTILGMGFIEQLGGLFFRRFFTESVASILTAGNYFDLSGLEFTTNKFHVEDYCNGQNEFESALIFLNAFTESWQQKFPSKTCNAVTSFQVDAELGNVATFSFYVERPGQDVIDVHKISEFENATYVRRIVATNL